MKSKLAILLTAALLAPGMASAAPANPAAQPDLLTGDTKLACEAILCLSSGTRPSECNLSLDRYFRIHHKKMHKTIQARENFLNLCPTSGEKGIKELNRALANGAGRCDAKELNRVMRRTITVRECKVVANKSVMGSWGNRKPVQECQDVQKVVVLNAKPSYCTAYHNHEWTLVSDTVQYVGDPKQGGKWVDVQQ